MAVTAEPDRLPCWRFLPVVARTSPASAVSQPEVCRFPLIEATELAWLSAALTHQPALLAAALVYDPAAVHWARLAAGPVHAFATLGDCARWMVEQGLSAKLWATLACPPVQSGLVPPFRWRRLAVASTQAAFRSAAAGGVLQDPRRAPWHEMPQYFQAVLQNGERWLAAAVVSTDGAVSAGDGDDASQQPEGLPLAALQSLAAETASRWQSERLRGPALLAELVRRDSSAAPLPPAANAELSSAELEAAKLAALAEFAAGAGHEINNPLAVISGRAQLLLTSETDPQRRHDLATIHAQAVRVHEMIADLMFFARPPEPQLAAFDVVAAIDRLLAELAGHEAHRHVVFRRSGASGPVEVVADPAQLLAAIRAVCLNSLFALQGHGSIEIEVTPAPGELHIAIRDDGPGISPAVREHLFDPYFSGRESGRGLGIGLSKVWRIIDQHGGRVEVESELGQGTTIALILPSAKKR